MEYQSKYTGAEVDALLDKVNNGGGNFDSQGVYPDLTAGDLAGRGESVPASFGFRASGGKSIKDGRAYIKRIKGNSVVWNQLLPNSTIQVTSNATRALNEGTRIVVGHKYLLLADFDGGTDYASVTLYARVNGESKAIFSLGNNEGKIYKFVTAEIGGVSNGTGSAEEGNIWQYFYFEGTTESITNTRLIDLTQMFQAGNEPSTIEEFNARVATLGVDMNAYNEGQVIHCNTESIKSVGDNAWDEEWENGSIDMESGRGIEASNQIRPINYIRVLPNTEYHAIKGAAKALYLFYYDKDKNYLMYQDPFATSGTGGKFTTPQGVYYMRFFYYDTAYHNDICISLYHSGWKAQKDDQYQPYWQDILPLPIIRKYFPYGMKSAGTAHDEIRFNKASGKWEYSKGKIKGVDLGSLTFSEWQDGMYAANLVDMAIKGQILCAKYSTDTYTNVTAKNTGIAALTDKGGIVIYDATYTTPSAIKTALQGVILYYEAAEWEWVELDAEDQNFRDYYNVADFGTEQSQSNVPSAAFFADIIYQFNAVDMIREHEIEITELQKVIATMQAQLASLTSNNA